MRPSRAWWNFARRSSKEVHCPATSPVSFVWIPKAILCKARSSHRRNANWKNLPMPARDLVDLAPYREAWLSAHGQFSTNMVASRGCPYHCNWCAKPISGNKFQLRSPQLVAAEIRELKEAYGVEHIWFGDDIFALNQHWVQEFADAMETLQCRLPFKIQSRADLMTRETVNGLKRAGCAEVWMGVESGSQRVLDAMSKGLRCRRGRRRAGAPWGRRHSRMLLPAVRLPRGAMGRHSANDCAGA